jgi:hypothetical protein
VNIASSQTGLVTVTSTATPLVPLTVVDNLDGTLTVTGAGVVDNGDGTLTIPDADVTDNGDGTLTLLTVLLPIVVTSTTTPKVTVVTKSGLPITVISSTGLVG